MKYVYCLTKNIGQINIPTPGIGGAKIHQVFEEKISAFVSDGNLTSMTCNTSNIITHQMVVQEAFRVCNSLIPCRFGTIFSDLEEIQAVLKKHYDGLFTHLIKIEDKFEVSARLILSELEENKSPPMETENPKEGGQYLLSKKKASDFKKELHLKAQEYCSAMNKATTPFWEEVIEHEQCVGNSFLVSLYYLLRREELPPFKTAFQKFKETMPELKLQYSGPWPPYNFSQIQMNH